MTDSTRRQSRSSTSLPFELSRKAKSLVVLSVDISLCVLTTWLAHYLRLGEFPNINEEFARPIFLSISVAIPIFASTGLYRAIFRYSGWPAIYAVGRAMTVYTLIYMIIITVVGLDGTPRTIGIIQPLLLFFFLASSRLLARFIFDRTYRAQFQKDDVEHVMIYGAGAAGRQLAVALGNSREMRVIGFFDDDDRLHGHIINGLPVFAIDNLSDLIAAKGVSLILLAMPSVPRVRRQKILKHISRHQIMVRTLPSVSDLAEGRVTISDIQDLDIDDLLGRDSVLPDQILLNHNISRKTVLVTGAGGSIGSELCRQILKLQPKNLLLVEVSEYSLYSIHSELESLNDALERRMQCLIVPLLASVTDIKRMANILDAWQPDTVYHAAAYKHVPLVEYNLAEGVKNNVIGTLTIAQLAIEKGVSNFVLISTDKAVRPTNVMGASKRLAEMCVQALYESEVQQKHPKVKTKLSMVRFGNVLDSSGSVIPKFRKQIRNGGPITLTHPEITRYFMTISEATQLVLQAGAMAKGGDVFVLDMGEAVKIKDLARSMIELSGLTVRDDEFPEGDIEIVITGLRPGEKLYEELQLGDDPQTSQHPKIQRAQDNFMPWDQLKTYINMVQIATDENNVEGVMSLLQELVTGYKPSSEIVDWIHREKCRSANTPPSCN